MVQQTARPTVLVVDDDPDVAEAHALELRDSYETRLAHGGEAALDAMDGDVDAVLLDRRMPRLHGDEVLARIREAGYDCPVVMVTAVDPDLNILEMDFDDYLPKPVRGETLLETLDQHVNRQYHDERLDEFFRLVSKKEVLEDELSVHERANDDEYQRLTERIESLGRELAADVPDFESLVDTYRDVNRSSA